MLHLCSPGKTMQQNNFKTKESTIRRLCREGGGKIIGLPYGNYLRLGKKRQSLVNAPVIPKIDINKIIDTSNMFDDIPL